MDYSRERWEKMRREARRKPSKGDYRRVSQNIQRVSRPSGSGNASNNNISTRKTVQKARAQRPASGGNSNRGQSRLPHAERPSGSSSPGRSRAGRPSGQNTSARIQASRPAKPKKKER